MKRLTFSSLMFIVKHKWKNDKMRGFDEKRFLRFSFSASFFVHLADRILKRQSKVSELDGA